MSVRAVGHMGRRWRPRLHPFAYFDGSWTSSHSDGEWLSDDSRWRYR